MRLQQVQTNFTAGEVSGRLYGRSDLARYQNGVKTALNMVVQQHGGMTRRPGTIFAARARGNANPRLIPFQYSSEQSYVVEFTNTNCRFYRGTGQVQYSDVAGGSEPTVNGATWASDVATITTATAHKFAVGDLITLTFVNSPWDSINGNNYVVTAVTSTTFDFALDADPGTYSGHANDVVDGPYTISAPYGTSDLADLTYTQSADILYICHKDYEPRELQRTGVDEFAFSVMTHKDGPYLPINTNSSRTITTVSGTGSQNFTLSGTFITTANVGQQLRWQDTAGSGWGWGDITAVSGTTLTVDVQNNHSGTHGAATEWRLGAWGGVEDYPQACGFHQQRLFMANTPRSPQALWSSETGDFEAWRPSLRTDGSVTDTMGLTYIIDDEQVNDIRWIVSAAGGLLVGTGGAEFLLVSDETNGTLTPTSIVAHRQTSGGNRSFIRPSFINGVALFIQRSGRKVREMSYRLDNDQYNSIDLTLLSEHITNGKIARIAYQQEPNSILWACDEDGQLLSMTYEREENVIGWTAHTIGGTDAKVNDICNVFESDEDRLWLVVERTVGGGTVRFIEYLGQQFGIDRPIEDAGFVDSCLVYSGSATTTITGLHYLEGETLQVLADGAVQPDVAVSNASVTIQTAASDVQLGYGYTSRVETLPIYVIRAPFEARGRLASVYKVELYFYRSVGAKVGSSDQADADLETVGFRDGGQDMNSAVAPLTGYREVAIDDRHSTEATIVILQDQPLPMTVLSAIYKLDVNDV